MPGTDRNSRLQPTPDSMELEHTGCVMCGCDQTGFSMQFSPPDLPGCFNLERCPACRTVFVNPHPTRAQIAAFFSNPNLFQKTKDPEGRARSMIRERERRRSEFSGYARFVRKNVPHGRVLDVGCGLGLFLEILGPGYDRVGLDINPWAANYVRQKLQIEVLSQDAMETEFAPQSFDVVTVMQTLDHFDHPGMFLKKAVSWLKPGGLVFLASLINLNSLCARLFREDYRLLHPYHLAYFTPKTVREILRRLGLMVVKLEYPYFKTPYFNTREVTNLFHRTFRRVFLPRNKSSERLLSPPCLGNTINVYAVKEMGS